MASNDALVNICKEHGHKVEPLLNTDGTKDHNTMVIDFPCKAGDDAIVASEMSAIKQLELVKKLQETWADNSISVTVYYKDGDLPEIKEWMKVNYKYLKTVSFLKHAGNGFTQTPYEEITKEKYEELVKLIKPFKHDDYTLSIGEQIENLECAGGTCPIR